MEYLSNDHTDGPNQREDSHNLWDEKWHPFNNLKEKSER